MAAIALAGCEAEHVQQGGETPDAMLRIEFQEALPSPTDLREMPVQLIYRPSRPDEPGTPTEQRRAHCPQQKIPIPFPCLSRTERAPAVRLIQVRKEWIRPVGATSIDIQVPERLSGPGAYRLQRVKLSCVAALCRNLNPVDQWELDFAEGPRDDKVSSNLVLGVDLASTFSAQYAGKALHLVEHLASQQASGTSAPTSHTFQPVVQDPGGRWHLSDFAFGWRWAPSCPSASQTREALRLGPGHALYFKWMHPFRHASASWDFGGSARQHGHIEDAPATISARTGCVRVQGEEIAGGPTTTEEQRQYLFDQGRVRTISQSRWDGKLSTHMTISFDLNRNVEFVHRAVFHHRSQQEVITRWSRLEARSYTSRRHEISPIDPTPFLREAELALAFAEAALQQR